MGLVERCDGFYPLEQSRVSEVFTMRDALAKEARVYGLEETLLYTIAFVNLMAFYNRSLWKDLVTQPLIAVTDGKEITVIETVTREDRPVVTRTTRMPDGGGLLENKHSIEVTVVFGGGRHCIALEGDPKERRVVTSHERVG